MFFSELGALLPAPSDFLAVAGRLGCRRSKTELLTVSLKDLVPNNIEMNIHMMLPASEGRELDECEAARLEAVLAEVQEVNQRKRQLLDYLEAQMQVIAPNVLGFLESANLTARLVAAAGGIKALAETPPGNIEVMGSVKRDTGGLSTQHAQLHRGIIGESGLVKGTPQDHQR